MKHITSLLVIFMAIINQAYSQEKYEILIDLTSVVDDKVKVTYKVPEVDTDTIEFHIPKIVPGTYSIYDFGRFVEDFEALDSKGNPLITNRISDNRISIANAGELESISYWVEDTYDTQKGNVIFEPAGSSIEIDTVYVINTFTMVGYLDGMKDLPYELVIQKPKTLFGATALDKQVVNDTTDVFSSANYFDLADGPIMYSVPDTTTFKVGGAEILISVYSPTGVLKSSFVKDQVIPTLEAQKEYMGGELPVKKYAFLIYLFQGPSLSGGYGALEHSYSSMYNLPEADPNYLAQIIRDVAAHEFFHIVTPLNIHSEEIGNFDFINPVMSKHLWLYEGMTEYAAGLAQVKYGEMSMDHYLDIINKKIANSKKFRDDLPFTEMSATCLQPDVKDQYYNVYEKGALIGMALDIRLRQLSDGDYGVEQLMIELSNKYGKEKSFKDKELFDVITEMTYPEIRDFFSSYVEGKIPIPYGDFLALVGVDFEEGKSTKTLSLGKISFGVQDTLLSISSISQMNQFGKDMGYLEDDLIYKLCGVKIDIGNYKEEIAAFKERQKPGDMVSVTVLRDNGKGKLKKKKLKAKAIEVPVKEPGYLRLTEETSAEQLSLRKAWVNK